MEPSKRISKKQIKEDKLVNTALKTSEYVQNNPKPFIIGGSVIAVIFIVFILFKWSADSKSMDAASLLIRANLSIDMGESNNAIMDLQTIINDYSGTESAGLACLNLATLYFSNENYEEALRYYNIMISQYDDNPLMTANAASGAAVCYTFNGDFSEAARLFKLAADVHPDDIWAPDFLMKAAENYRNADDKEAAIQAYNEIIDNYPRATILNDAKKALAEVSY